MSGYFELSEEDVMLLVEALNSWLHDGVAKDDYELRQYLKVKDYLLHPKERQDDQG